jgi:hypothetical protein
MEPSKIWIKQCEAARIIGDEFGTERALNFLIGEKFLSFLEAAERLPDYRAELPAFVAQIKTIFEPSQLAECLLRARQTEPFDLTACGDDEAAEMKRQDDLRRTTANLLLAERAKEWLLGEGS